MAWTRRQYRNWETEVTRCKISKVSICTQYKVNQSCRLFVILARLIISGCCILFERNYAMLSFEFNINLVCFLYETYNVFSTVEIGYFVLFFACFYAICLCGCKRMILLICF